MPANEVIYCMINEKGGRVSVKLRANNALATGSEFALWASDAATERERWKLSAGTTGEGMHPITVSPKTIPGNYLSWAITVCSVLSAGDTGTVEIEISQDGVSCPLTKDLRWSLENVPQCDAAGDNVIKIRRKLTFRTA